MYLLVMVLTLYLMMLVRLESTSSSGKPLIMVDLMYLLVMVLPCT